MSKKLIIVGGGYAGSELAAGLDSHMDVTLIDQNSVFVHSSAAIRSVVVPELLDKILIPFDKLLKKGKFVQARVEKLKGMSVTLDNGKKLKADYIVIATGSNYAQPFKTNGKSIESFKKVHAKTHAMIAQNKRVTILGGGPVGIELAGEIRSVYQDKEINLVTREKSLFPHLNPDLGKSLLKQLKEMKINVFFNTGGGTRGSVFEPHVSEVFVTGNKFIPSGLVFPAFGAKASNPLLDSIDDVELNHRSRANHDGWLRPSPSNPTLFVCGDAAASGDDMTIVSAARQAPWLIKTLKTMAAGKPIEKLAPYEPWPVAPLLVPLGPKKGASIMPVGANGKVVGARVTRMIKGKDLFISKYRKLFGQK